MALPFAVGPPAGAVVTTHAHRIAFYETDAMGVVHHSNTVRFFERARIQWMDEHHRPYHEYVAVDRHFATTRVEVDYRRSARFDDTLEVACWLEWVRGASLRIAYRVTVDDDLVSTGATEHALVDLDGRVRRIPGDWRAELAAVALPGA